MKSAETFLRSISSKYARQYSKAVHDLYIALVVDNKPAARDARMRLEEAVTYTMGMAEIYGATQVLKGAAAFQQRLSMRRRVLNPAMFAEQIAQVTFDEAIEDMVTRAPKTIKAAAERTAQRISQLYSEGKVVAFAKSAEASVTKAARNFVVTAMKEGVTESDAGRRLSMTVAEVSKKTEPWSESYSRMAYRTNVNTATTAGRFRQAQDEVIKEIMPAFRYDAVGDSDTRKNHKAADGVVLKTDNPKWRYLAPPLGYNCRCDVVFVPAPLFSGETRVPPGAHPDIGFRLGARPDLFISQGGKP